MDIPGLHVDGGAITALLVLLNTLVTIYIGRTAVKTKDAVNGVMTAKVAEAHAAGVVQGAGLTPPPTPAAPA